jgi:hypothetical protein
MFTKAGLLLVLTLVGNASIAQSNDWVSKQQQQHIKFHSEFYTKDYICEVKSSAEVKFDITKNAWGVDLNHKYEIGKKELVRIIKSDDISTPIPLCGVNDRPLSSNFYANKYLCLIMTHPKRVGYQQFLSSPDEVDATHYKCLLNIETRYGKSDVNTLACNGQFKFSLTHSKYFDSDLSIGPYSGTLEEKLSQKIRAADCTNINN